MLITEYINIMLTFMRAIFVFDTDSSWIESGVRRDWGGAMKTSALNMINGVWTPSKTRKWPNITSTYHHIYLPGFLTCAHGADFCGTRLHIQLEDIGKSERVIADRNKIQKSSSDTVTTQTWVLWWSPRQVTHSPPVCDLLLVSSAIDTR